VCGVYDVSVCIAEDPKGGQLRFTYVQGMNCLLAPLLYVMPEADAFFTFDVFLRKALPIYVQPSLEGVNEGVKVSFFVLESEEKNEKKKKERRKTKTNCMELY